MVSNTTIVADCLRDNGSHAPTATSWKPNEPSAYYISFYVEITIVAAIGFVGNCQLIALFYRRHRKLYRAVNLFMLLLATIDLTACLWTMPYAVLYVSHDLDSEIACKAGFYISGSIEMMSMTTSTIIAAERLRAVRNPHRPPTSRQTACAQAAGMAGASFVLMSGLIACMTIDEQGECNLNAARPRAASIYLMALSAIIILIYVGDFVIYALIFAALRKRARMAERRRNTITSIGSGGTLRRKPALPNAAESSRETRALEHNPNEHVRRTEQEPQPGSRPREKPEPSPDDRQSQLPNNQPEVAGGDKPEPSPDDRQSRLPNNQPEAAGGTRQEDTEQKEKQETVKATDGQQPPSVNSQAILRRSLADAPSSSSVDNKPITIVSFTKKRSFDNAAVAAVAEPGVSTSRKLHLPLPLPPQGHRQWPTQPPSLVASSPTSPSGASGTGRLSWSAEAGRNWAAQDVRSSAFLVIVLISLVSWAPFFLSISFPSALGLDMPHFRFLFFLNHVTNVFVYLALSPHIRTQLKISLLYPIRRCQARRG